MEGVTWRRHGLQYAGDAADAALLIVEREWAANATVQKAHCINHCLRVRGDIIVSRKCGPNNHFVEGFDRRAKPFECEVVSWSESRVVIIHFDVLVSQCGLTFSTAV